MKRILVFLLAMWLAMQGSALAEETMVVTGGWLRLREAASFDAPVISRHYTGTRVTVLQQQDIWRLVQLANGVQGWMNAAYLQPAQEAVAAQAVITSPNGGSVNVRTGPGTSYPVKATLAPGTQLTVESLADAWCFVTAGSLTGYVKRTYISQDGAVQAVRYITSENGGSVNLRRGQGRSYQSRGLYPPGTRVTLLRQGETWSYVSINGQTGYIMTRYLADTPSQMPMVAIRDVRMSSTQPRVGERLSAVLNPYSAQAVFVWTDDAGRILGSGQHYVVVQDDAGQRIRVTAIGYGAGDGAAVSQVSSPVQD